MATVHILILNTIMMTVLTAYCQNHTFWEYKRLHEHLNGNLDDTIRPLINQSNSIAVDIEVYLQAIQGLDEKEQLLQSTIAISCRWKYETLTWNTSEFGGINRIKIPAQVSWIPDLMVSNSVDSMYILTENRDNKAKISVMSNGDATWYTGGHLRTSCHIDITKYPFDTQTCTIIIGNTELDSEVAISASSDKVTTTTYDENGEWNLKNSVVKKRMLNDNRAYLDIHLTMKRHSLFYILNVVLPVMLLSFMTVLCFKVPVAGGERLGYSISLLLTFVVMLNLISESMPRVPKHVSYLQLYVIYQLTIAVVITTLSIFLVNMSQSQNEASITRIADIYNWCNWFRQRKTIDTKVPLDKTSKSDVYDDARGEVQNNKSQSKLEADLDRQSMIQRIGDALYWIFMTMFIISTILFLIIVTN